MEESCIAVDLLWVRVRTLGFQFLLICVHHEVSTHIPYHDVLASQHQSGLTTSESPEHKLKMSPSKPILLLIIYYFIKATRILLIQTTKEFLLEILLLLFLPVLYTEVASKGLLYKGYLDKEEKFKNLNIKSNMVY